MNDVPEPEQHWPRGRGRLVALGRRTDNDQQSHRFVITGEDPDGHPRTIILWRETDLVDGKVVRRVHVTLDATIVTETILTRDEAIKVAEAILAAAR